jgi:hypothetical protein
VSSLPAIAGGSEAVLVSWLLHIVIESGSVLVTSCSRWGVKRCSFLVTSYRGWNKSCLVFGLLVIEGGSEAV